MTVRARSDGDMPANGGCWCALWSAAQKHMLRTMAGLAVGCIVPDGACTGFDLGQLFGAINSTTVRRAAMSHPLILAMNACPFVCY